MKKVLAILMCLALVLSLYPVFSFSVSAEDAPAIDLTQGAVVTASASWEDPWVSKSLLIDGNPTTFYMGVDTNQQDVERAFQTTWIQLDLQKTYIIDKYEFSTYAQGQELGMPKDFTIEVSADGTNWTTAYTQTDLALENQQVYSFSFEPVAARYVKLNVTAIRAAFVLNGTPFGNIVALAELGVYGAEKAEETPDLPEIPTPTAPKIDLYQYVTNLVDPFPLSVAVQPVATASASYQNWGIGIAALLDNNTSETSRYVGVNEANAPLAEFVETWIQLDLQKTYTIDQVTFSSWGNNSPNGLPTAFTIQVSTNGTDWTTVHTETAMAVTEVTNSNLYSFPLNPVDARYVKLNVTAIGGPADASLGQAVVLNDLSVYGTEKAGETPEPPVSTSAKIDLTPFVAGMTSPSGFAQSVATASESLEVWNFGIAALLDDDINTEFVGLTDPNRDTATPFQPTWIQLDLQKVYTLDKLEFNSHAQGNTPGLPKTFTIEVSTNGTDWTTVHTEENLTLIDSTLYAFSFAPTDARYIKLNVTDIHGPWDLGNVVVLRSLDVYGTEKAEETPEPPTPPVSTSPKIDLSGYVAGMTSPSGFAQSVATASESLEVWNFGIAALLDNDINTEFVGLTDPNRDTATPFQSTWIQLDLQKVYTLDKLEFNSHAQGDKPGLPKTFTIEVSENGTDWTTVHTEENLTLINSTLYTFSFAPVDARYVRLNVTDIHGPWDLGNVVVLRSLDVYGTAKEEEKPQEPELGELIPVAPGNAAASGNFGGNYAMENLFDKDLNTLFAAIDPDKAPGTRMDDWVQLDLQQVYTVSRIRLANRSDGVPLSGLPSVFDVMVSTDGENWTVVKSVDGISESDITELHWLTVDFEAVQARYVRIRAYDIAVIGEASLGYAMALREFEVHTAEGKIDLSGYVSDIKDGWASGHSQTVATASDSYEQWGWGIAGLIDGVVGANAIFSGAPNAGELPVVGMKDILILDLKGAYKLDGLQFAAMTPGSLAGLPVNFTVEVSLDSAQWTTVLIKNGLSTADADADGQTYTFPIDPTEPIRFVRITVTRVGDKANDELGYCTALSELALYGTLDPSVVIKPDGWGKIDLTKAIIRATNSYNMWGHGAGNLYNGDLSANFFAPVSADDADYYVMFKDSEEFPNECDEFIKIKLDGIYELDLMQFQSRYAGIGSGVPNHYKLEVSLDGKTWTTALEVNGQEVSVSDWYSQSFDTVQARYLRLNFYNVVEPGDLGYVPHLKELEFYGVLIEKDVVDLDVPAPEPPVLEIIPGTGDEAPLVVSAVLLTAAIVMLAVLVFGRRKFEI